MLRNEQGTGTQKQAGANQEEDKRAQDALVLVDDRITAATTGRRTRVGRATVTAVGLGRGLGEAAAAATGLLARCGCVVLAVVTVGRRDDEKGISHGHAKTRKEGE